MNEYRSGEHIKFKPRHDPEIDHTGYIIRVIKDANDKASGKYLVEDRDWGPVEVHESEIIAPYP